MENFSDMLNSIKYVKLKNVRIFMCETGIYQILGDLRYFIPHSLPPSYPLLEPKAAESSEEAYFFTGLHSQNLSSIFSPASTVSSVTFR